MIEYKGYKEIDLKLWDKFVKENPDSNIFHSYEFTKAIDKLDNISVIVLSQQKENEIVALGVGYIYSEFSNKIMNKLTSRALFLGGILKTEFAEVSHFVKELERVCKLNGAIYTRIVQYDEDISKKIFENEKFKYIQSLNYLFFLNQGKDAIWRNFKSKKRQNIRKATKLGLKVVEGNKDDIEEVYNCILFTYNKLKLPLYKKEFLETIFNELYDTGNIKIFITKLDDKLVATRISLYFNKKAYDWYAGSYDGYNKFNANDVLVWKSLETAINKGCKIFDFGGAGTKGKEYSVRDYKSKFGGELVILPSYKKDYYPYLANLFSLGKKIRTFF